MLGKYLNRMKTDRTFTIIIASAITILVAFADYFSGVEMSMSILYFVPIAIVTWYVGFAAGLIAALLSAVIWLMNDNILSNHHYDIRFFAYWNAFVRFCIFTIIAIVISKIKSMFQELAKKNEELDFAYRELNRVSHEQLELKDKILSNVSHELKTPLTALHGFITILQEGIAGEVNEEQKEYLDIAMRNTMQLNKMIGDLLDATRSESGKLTFSFEVAPITSVAEDIVKVFTNPAARKGIQLKNRIPDELPDVYMDVSRVRQVLINLVDNALKFTPEGGSVTLEAKIHEKTGKHILFTVSDTGIGISVEDMERLFARLYQVKNDTEDARKGLGLGLYISKAIIEAHNGSIWIESKKDKGSRFLFTLPIEDEEQTETL